MIYFLDLVHRSTSEFLDLVHRSTTLLSVSGVVGFRQKTVNFVLVQMLTGLRKSLTQWQRRWVQSASVVSAASACSVSNVARPPSIAAVKKEKSRTGVGGIRVSSSIMPQLHFKAQISRYHIIVVSCLVSLYLRHTD